MNCNVSWLCVPQKDALLIAWCLLSLVASYKEGNTVNSVHLFIYLCDDLACCHLKKYVKGNEIMSTNDDPIKARTEENKETNHYNEFNLI